MAVTDIQNDQEGTEAGVGGKGTELKERAKAFIQEYKKYGFYRNMSLQDEDEAIRRIVERVAEDKGWPNDWWLIHDDRNTYWFDCEWMGDLEHMYSEFLAELSKISRGELKFENFTEFVDLEEHEGASWVEFDWMARRHHIDAKGMSDYVDYPSLVSYINEELRKSGNPRRFLHPFPTDDQTAIIAFLSLEELKRLQTEKGWPVDVDNSFLLAPLTVQPAAPAKEKRSSLESLFKRK